jgi:hypothetical protein
MTRRRFSYAIGSRRRAAERQDLCDAAQGCGDPEPIFRRQPRHPGVAHYLIHLYDTPALAEKGLDAAKRYSQIAPAAPGMRSTCRRISSPAGYWKDRSAQHRSGTVRQGQQRGPRPAACDDYPVMLICRWARC